MGRGWSISFILGTFALPPLSLTPLPFPPTFNASVSYTKPQPKKIWSSPFSGRTPVKKPLFDITSLLYSTRTIKNEMLRQRRCWNASRLASSRKMHLEHTVPPLELVPVKDYAWKTPCRRIIITVLRILGFECPEDFEMGRRRWVVY